MKTTAGIANEGLGINALDQQAVTEGTAQAVVGIMMALAAGFVAAVTGN